MASGSGGDWSAGYVTEIDYTHGYYAELNPLRAAWPLLCRGYAMPEVTRACELAFGQGLSINLHAAAGSARWWGNDFNPAQAAFAQELAAKAGRGACLSDESFAEFNARNDLPTFDFIGLHGIYSWVTLENRAQIVDFIARRLKPGGVLYLSYNCYPGWAAAMPLQRLMAEHARRMSAPGGGVLARFAAAQAFAEQLIGTDAAYGRDNPTVAERLAQMRGQNRHYLAHEYLNAEWQPMLFSEVARDLAAAKLAYAGPAHYPELVDAINLTPAQAALLAEQPDPVFRELVRDFLTNQTFRRDYWIKGGRSLRAAEQADAMRAQRFVLTARPEDVTMTIAAPGGDVSLHPPVYQPLLAALADLRPRTVAELEAALGPAHPGFANLIEAITVLAAKGDLAPAASDADAAHAQEACARLNAALLARAARRSEITALASPLLGGGIAASRFQQLFLAARAAGIATPDGWAAAAWQTIDALGERVSKAGQPLPTAAENRAALQAEAADFAHRRLPVLQALGVV